MTARSPGWRRALEAATYALLVGCAASPRREDAALGDALHAEAAIDAGDTLPDVQFAPEAAVDVTSSASPRLVAPLSGAVATSQHPTLRWAAGSSDARVVVALCADRACLHPLTTLEATGDHVRLPTPLAAGTVFWRVSSAGTGASSPTWQFIVRHRDAPIDTSWGAALDPDGDGLADALVAESAPWEVLVFEGHTTGFAGTPVAALVDPVPGMPFGQTLAVAGDLDGDGFVDVAVGAESEPVYVVRGGAAGLAAATPTEVRDPRVSDALFGWAIASAGDANADGYGDLVIGSPTRAASGSGGTVSLVLGQPGGVPVLAAQFAAPDGDASQFGTALAAGDLNGDGYGDLVLGADCAFGGAPCVPSAMGTGRVYVYCGGPALTPSHVVTGFAASPCGVRVLNAPDGTPGFGTALAVADLDDDGYGDIVVGATDVGEHGALFVFPGGPTGPAVAPVLRWASPVGPGSQFARRLANAGDVDGDGYDDLIVGERGASRAWLFRGSAAGLTAAAMQHIDGYLDPDPASDHTRDDTYLGTLVAGAGDTNGDGFADVLIGTYQGWAHAGVVYVYRGSAAGLDASAATRWTGDDAAGPRQLGIDAAGSVL